MSRLPVAALAIAAFYAVPELAAAQDTRPDDAVVQRLVLNPTVVITSAPTVLLDAAPLPALIPPVTFERPSTRASVLLLSLYASTTVMQALDVHSTMTALNHGAVEANPLMRRLASNRTAFVAMKAGVTASTILATRNLAKRNKAAAIVAMVAINSAYAMAMRHNYKVARNQRGGS